MKHSILAILILMIGLSTKAQFNSTFKKSYEYADALMYEEDYIDALPVFLKLDSMAPNNANIAFNIGLCYLNSYNDKLKAIPYLEKASQSISADYYGNFNEVTAPVFTFYFLGRAYHLAGQFDLAIDYYNKFKYYLTADDKELMRDVDRQTEMAYNAKNLIARPIMLRRDNLGTVINSEYPDYAPVVSPDMKYLIFTSRRPGSTGGKKDTRGKFFEDIYIADFNTNSREYSNVRPLEGGVNTEGHEASISMSWDGQMLFVYKDDKGDGNIYMSRLGESQWATPIKMGPEINTRGYENHACLSPEGDKLYFVSKREGGYGGKDIWMVKRIGRDKWSQPENLGPRINTEYDEESPILLSDGKTIYFSSKGHESMGGFDIFFSVFNENQWSIPENIGYPLNTTDDDLFFVPTLDGSEAFYSSAQAGGNGDLDIYHIIISSNVKQIAVLNGFVRDTVTQSAILAKIEIIDLSNGQIFAQTSTDIVTGEYSVTLNAGNRYKLLVTTPDGQVRQEIIDVPMHQIESRSFNKPFYFKQEIVQSKIDTILNKINVGQRMGDRFVLRDVYFDFDKFTLRPESKVELDRLVALLIQYPTIKIELSGHTDNRGSEAYNKTLSLNRAKAVVDYLVAAGIDPNRLSYKGYGFEQPIASNETDAGRQLNRRTEFKVMGFGTFNPSQIAENWNNNNSNNQNNSNYNDVIKDYQVKYYVIGGSFMFLRNAERFQEEMIAKGFASAEVVGQNSTGSYRVSLKSFSSKAEAIKELPKLRELSGDPGLWILEK